MMVERRRMLRRVVLASATFLVGILGCPLLQGDDSCSEERGYFTESGGLPGFGLGGGNPVFPGLFGDFVCSRVTFVVIVRSRRVEG